MDECEMFWGEIMRCDIKWLALATYAGACIGLGAWWLNYVMIGCGVMMLMSCAAYCAEEMGYIDYQE